MKKTISLLAMLCALSPLSAIIIWDDGIRAPAIKYIHNGEVFNEDGTIWGNHKKEPALTESQPSQASQETDGQKEKPVESTAKRPNNNDKL